MSDPVVRKLENGLYTIGTVVTGQNAAGEHVEYVQFKTIHLTIEKQTANVARANQRAVYEAAVLTAMQELERP